MIVGLQDVTPDTCVTVCGVSGKQGREEAGEAWPPGQLTPALSWASVRLHSEPRLLVHPLRPASRFALSRHTCGPGEGCKKRSALSLQCQSCFEVSTPSACWVQRWTPAAMPATGWCATTCTRCQPGTRRARAGAAPSARRGAPAEAGPAGQQGQAARRRFHLFCADAAAVGPCSSAAILAG